MDIMYLRRSSRVKASVVLTRADYYCVYILLCIHYYIIPLLNNIVRPILLVDGLEPASYVKYTSCLLRLS